MKRFLERPFLVFLSIIPVLLLIGFFFKDEVFDINIHDTYFVFYGKHLSQFLSLILLFIALGYWVVWNVGKKPYKWLTLLHVVFTIIGLISLFIVYFMSMFKNYQISSDNTLLDSLDLGNILLTLGFLIFIIAQIFYPINIFLSLLRKRHD